MFVTLIVWNGRGRGRRSGHRSNDGRSQQRSKDQGDDLSGDGETKQAILTRLPGMVPLDLEVSPVHASLEGLGRGSRAGANGKGRLWGNFPAQYSSVG